MASKQGTSLSELLDAGLALAPERRLAWVESLGPELDAIKPRLRALLGRSGSAASGDLLGTLPRLEEETEPELTRFDAAAHGKGSLVGRYRLLTRLGAGAMGVVWLAEDGGSDGRTQVALKFAHMAQRRPDLPARMAREQQLLAALDHPNIARMYDAGVTPEGQPYLVLEYVRGQVLDAYCSSHKPSLEQRLELFIQIASAVAHAHARQIVHRDLKPANVMVTSDGTARLLDFGIGKLLTEGMPAEFQLTLMAGQPLTPAYASPEQIAGGTVGFPTDIYSLGVMFYELLVGVRPYIYKRGSNRALREAILEATPIVPSAATDDVALRARLQGELDVAVLRALRKQPEARHASVQAFVDAVEHARAR